MPLHNYTLVEGVVKQIIGPSLKNKRIHYHLVVLAASEEYMITIAVNGKGSGGRPEAMQVFVIEDFRERMLSLYQELGRGTFNLRKFSEDYRLDFVDSGFFDAQKVFAGIKPRTAQELSEVLDQHLEEGSRVYVAGEGWNLDTISEHMQHYQYERDNYEAYWEEAMPYGAKLSSIDPGLPRKGIHCIHLNQGSSWDIVPRVNGRYQDGLALVEKTDGQVVAFFFKFEGQSLNNDSKGNPR